MDAFLRCEVRTCLLIVLILCCCLARTSLVLHKVALVRTVQTITCKRPRRYWMRSRLVAEHFPCYSLYKWINKWNYQCELMDGVRSNYCYQRNVQWKVWCGNRTVTRKSSIGALYICAVGLDVLKFEQTSLRYSDSYFNLGGLELCFGGAKRTKSTPSGDGTVWQNFSLLLNAIDSEKYLRYEICQTLFKHDMARVHNAFK